MDVASVFKWAADLSHVATEMLDTDKDTAVVIELNIRDIDVWMDCFRTFYIRHIESRDTAHRDQLQHQVSAEMYARLMSACESIDIVRAPEDARVQIGLPYYNAYFLIHDMRTIEELPPLDEDNRSIQLLETLAAWEPRLNLDVNLLRMIANIHLTRLCTAQGNTPS